MIKLKWGKIIEQTASREEATFQAMLLDEFDNEWGWIRTASKIKPNQTGYDYVAVISSNKHPKPFTIEGEYEQSEQFKSDLEMFFQRAGLQID